jgi:hypothetical protein
MNRWNLLAGSAMIVALAIAWPVPSNAQDQPQPAPPPLKLDSSRWEFSLGAYAGVPDGYIRVGENSDRGNRLRLKDDLGIKISESADLSATFHITPRDGIRLSFLYYFLRGQGLLDRSIVYNGEEFKNPGHVVTDADFWRASLAYERTGVVPGGFLTGSIGLTYVYFNPELTGHPTIGASHSNSEDFFRQELPVPIVGLRFDIPLGDRFAARVSIGGGGLPRVSTGRKEGGTVYLEQVHGDAAGTLTYAFTPNMLLEVGPRLTYFFQHEKSHEDDNAFQLIDYGVRVGLTFKF